jgi:hypothetical protein
MITIKKHDQLNIRVETDYPDYLEETKKYFTAYVENYYFQPKYRAGFWNGTITMLDWHNRTLPLDCSRI